MATGNAEAQSHKTPTEMDIVEGMSERLKEVSIYERPELEKDVVEYVHVS